MINPNEEYPIAIYEGNATPYLALQHDQLMSKYRVLRLKPDFRLEGQGE
jgi:hypothetical protein